MTRRDVAAQLDLCSRLARFVFDAREAAYNEGLRSGALSLLSLVGLEYYAYTSPKAQLYADAAKVSAFLHKYCEHPLAVALLLAPPVDDVNPF